MKSDVILLKVCKTSQYNVFFYPQSYLNRKDLVILNLKTNFFIQMKFIAALLGAINAVSVQGDYDAVEHTHVEHGTQ